VYGGEGDELSAYPILGWEEVVKYPGSWHDERYAHAWGCHLFEIDERYGEEIGAARERLLLLLVQMGVDLVDRAKTEKGKRDAKAILARLYAPCNDAFPGLMTIAPAA